MAWTEGNNQVPRGYSAPTGFAAALGGRPPMTASATPPPPTATPAAPAPAQPAPAAQGQPTVHDYSGANAAKAPAVTPAAMGNAVVGQPSEAEPPKYIQVDTGGGGAPVSVQNPAWSQWNARQQQRAAAGAAYQRGPGAVAAPTTPAAPAVATAADSAYEKNRGDLIDWLNQRAQGTGPSLAEEQVRQGLAREQAAQYGAAAAASPAQRATAMRAAMQNVGAIGAGAAQQAGMGRIAEQQAAQGTLAQVLQGAIGQQDQQGQFNAASQNQAVQMAYEAALQQAMQKAQLGSAWDIAKLGSQTQLQINQNNQPSWFDRLSGLFGSALPVIAPYLPKPSAPTGAQAAPMMPVFGPSSGMGSALSGAGGSLGGTWPPAGNGGYSSLPSF